MWRRGEGGDWCCIDCVLSTPDERDSDTQRVPSKFSFKPPRPWHRLVGNKKMIHELLCLFVCLFVLDTNYLDAWMQEFHLDSGDYGSHFEPGLNRDRLCCQRSRRSLNTKKKVKKSDVIIIDWKLIHDGEVDSWRLKWFHDRNNKFVHYPAKS